MDGQEADLYLTDPPYNVAYVGKTKDALTIENDKMDDAHFREFLFNAFTAAFGSLKPGGVFYVFHGESEGYNFRGAMHDLAEQVRQCLIWKKDSMVLGRQDYQWRHEPILYGWKKGAAHTWQSDRCQTSVLEYDRPKRSTDHPTMKPLELVSYLVQNSTAAGDLILDSFVGSGTSMIAAHRTGRRCFGIELDPKYCEVILRRAEAESLAVEKSFDAAAFDVQEQAVASKLSQLR
jgi:site-specific DNA-methyltransferase (adenine-specific)